MINEVAKDIESIGVDDEEIDLFEGQYTVPNGMCYNSYAIIDDKIAIMDTVDINFTHEWLDNIAKTLGNKKPNLSWTKRVNERNKIYNQIVSSLILIRIIDKLNNDIYSKTYILPKHNLMNKSLITQKTLIQQYL